MSETELIDRAEVKDGQALVAYSHTEAALAALREQYKGARYDLTTTAGDKAARAGRLALVTLRNDLEKKRKELKAPALEFGKKIDSEAARLTAEIVALETPIDAQIKADEKRRDDERRAKEEAEAARKKVHTDAIAKIAGYVAQAAELPAARIASGIAYLEAMELAGFEEYTEQATATRQRTVAALQALQVKAKAREDEEARLVAERAEQARIAAEQAETARKLQAERDDLARQQAELADAQAALQREQEAREATAREELEASERARQREILGMQRPAAYAEPQADKYLPTEPLADLSGAADNVHPLPTRAPAAPASPPTLRLGEIQKRIAPLSIDAAGLAALGFPFAKQEGAAKLWHEAAFPAIVDAAIKHLAQAKLKQLEAA